MPRGHTVGYPGHLCALAVQQPQGALPCPTVGRTHERVPFLSGHPCFQQDLDGPVVPTGRPCRAGPL